MVLQQTGTFDRLADDTRLYAHKLGDANPDQRVRLELYEDMVHVHQFFEFLPMADSALRSIVNFVAQAQDEAQRPLHEPNQQRQRRKKSQGPRSSRGKKETEWVVMGSDGSERKGHHDHGTPISQLETYWRPSSAKTD